MILEQKPSYLNDWNEWKIDRGEWAEMEEEKKNN